MTEAARNTPLRRRAITLLAAWPTTVAINFVRYLCLDGNRSGPLAACDLAVREAAWKLRDWGRYERSIRMVIGEESWSSRCDLRDMRKAIRTLATSAARLVAIHDDESLADLYAQRSYRLGQWDRHIAEARAHQPALVEHLRRHMIHEMWLVHAARIAVAVREAGRRDAAGGERVGR